jgi:hypothetical protein
MKAMEIVLTAVWAPLFNRIVPVVVEAVELV